MTEQLPPVSAPGSEQIPPVSDPVLAPVPVSSGNSQGLAIASLVLGILSLCGSVSIYCGASLSVVGIVLGALGLKTKGRTMAIAGIVLSALGLILAIIFRVVLRGVLFNNMWQQMLHSMGY